MDKPRPRVMDVTAPRRTDAPRKGWQLSRRQIISAVIAAIVLMAIIAGVYWYKHRNDQTIMGDHYQVVYLLTGQVYFGKLQNTDGEYLTLKNVYTLQSNDEDAPTQDETNILQVSRQVYGPEDSMAIRADQVQFWQNLRSDSKVAQAIDSVNK